jgi:RNA recognition motif-containing protein
MPRDEQKGHNKGVAFVELDNRDDAERFFKNLHGLEVENRRLRCDWDVGLQKKQNHEEDSKEQHGH